MKLCLSCRHLWPGSAVYCGHCSRSFGARLCEHGHASPPTAWSCVLCGSPDLTDPTMYLPFGWLTRLLIGIGAVLLVRWLSFHGAQAAEALRAFLEWGIALVSGRDPHALERTALRAAGIFFGSLLVLTLLPGRIGRYLWEVARRWLALLRILNALQRLLRGRGR